MGVNKFTSAAGQPVPSFKIDDSIRQLQMDKLSHLKSERNATEVAAKLEAIRKAAIENTNLMPPVIEAVEAWCTLGEIADVLRKEFGEYNQ